MLVKLSNNDSTRQLHNKVPKEIQSHSEFPSTTWKDEIAENIQREMLVVWH